MTHRDAPPYRVDLEPETSQTSQKLGVDVDVCQEGPLDTEEGVDGLFLLQLHLPQVENFGSALYCQEGCDFCGADFSCSLGLCFGEGVAATGWDVANWQLPAGRAVDEFVHESISGDDDYSVVLSHIDCANVFLAVILTLSGNHLQLEVGEKHK